MTIDDIVDYKVKANQEKGFCRGPKVYERLVGLFTARGASVMVGLTNDASSSCMSFYLWTASVNPVQCGIDTCSREGIFAWCGPDGSKTMQHKIYEGNTELSPQEIAQEIHDWLTDLLGPR